ncbi:unnamed protein product [Closterium sp. NIES-54]
MGVQERAERLAPKVRFWRVKCPQRHMAPFDRLPDMAHTEPCHIVVRCAVACAAHLLASRNPSHSTQAENIALLATQLVTVAATDARSNPSWLWKEAMALGAPVSSSPSRPPVYPPGLYSTKKPGSSGSSGSGGSGGSGGGGESEWDSERLQSVRSRSSAAAADDEDDDVACVSCSPRWLEGISRNFNKLRSQSPSRSSLDLFRSSSSPSRRSSPSRHSLDIARSLDDAAAAAAAASSVAASPAPPPPPSSAASGAAAAGGVDDAPAADAGTGDDDFDLGAPSAATATAAAEDDVAAAVLSCLPSPLLSAAPSAAESDDAAAAAVISCLPFGGDARGAAGARAGGKGKGRISPFDSLPNVFISLKSILQNTDNHRLKDSIEHVISLLMTRLNLRPHEALGESKAEQPGSATAEAGETAEGTVRGGATAGTAAGATVAGGVARAAGGGMGSDEAKRQQKRQRQAAIMAQFAANNVAVEPAPAAGAMEGMDIDGAWARGAAGADGSDRGGDGNQMGEQQGDVGRGGLEWDGMGGAGREASRSRKRGQAGGDNEGGQADGEDMEVDGGAEGSEGGKTGVQGAGGVGGIGKGKGKLVEGGRGEGAGVSAAPGGGAAAAAAAAGGGVRKARVAPGSLAAFTSFDPDLCGFCHAECRPTPTAPIGWVALAQPYKLPTIMHFRAQPITPAAATAAATAAAAAAAPTLSPPAGAPAAAAVFEPRQEQERPGAASEAAESSSGLNKNAAAEAVGAQQGHTTVQPTAGNASTREEDVGNASNSADRAAGGVEWTVGVQVEGSLDTQVTSHIRCCGHQVGLFCIQVVLCCHQAGLCCIQNSMIRLLPSRSTSPGYVWKSVWELLALNIVHHEVETRHAALQAMATAVAATTTTSATAATAATMGAAVPGTAAEKAEAEAAMARACVGEGSDKGHEMALDGLAHLALLTNTIMAAGGCLSVDRGVLAGLQVRPGWLGEAPPKWL